MLAVGVRRSFVNETRPAGSVPQERVSPFEGSLTLFAFEDDLNANTGCLTRWFPPMLTAILLPLLSDKSSVCWTLSTLQKVRSTPKEMHPVRQTYRS